MPLDDLLPPAAFPDVRELSPLQLAYLDDTLHDLFVRSRLIAHRAPVGQMHRRAVRFVSCEAQAAMLDALEPELTPDEADVVRRGRNAQARHAAPKHAQAAVYAKATGLEALWGWLYVTGQGERLNALMTAALSGMEEQWAKQN